jgi:hypothetical protein
MFYIASTRFTNETYSENINYRIKNENKIFYGILRPIRTIYPRGALIFVVEMNNNTNKIEGIGLIKNYISYEKHKIYSDNNYNRYCYKAKYWISKEDISNIDSDLVDILELVLFKGKSNMKRITGISILTDKLFKNWNMELNIIKQKVKNLFIRYFTNTNPNPNLNPNICEKLQNLC